MIAGEGKVKIPGLFSLRVFLYYVDGLLIDTGPSRLSREIKPFIMQHRPEQVGITHVHEDHCGLASWICNNFPDAPIYIHPSALDLASRPSRLPFYRKIFWGNRKSFRAQPYNGDGIRTDRHFFRVIHVGAHCPDHVVLYEEHKGWLFTGDIFVTSHPKVAFFEENYTEHIKALEMLLALKPKRIFCAHSGIHEEASLLLTDRLNYLLEVRKRVEKLRQQGLSDAKITEMLFPKKPLIVYFSRGEWSPYYMVRSL